MDIFMGLSFHKWGDLLTCNWYTKGLFTVKSGSLTIMWLGESLLVAPTFSPNRSVLPESTVRDEW